VIVRIAKDLMDLEDRDHAMVRQDHRTVIEAAREAIMEAERNDLKDR